MSKYEEGALRVEKLTSKEAVGTIVGAFIGSGCLSTAYASRYAGFPVLLTWLILGAFLTICTLYYIIECCYRTKKIVQLPGLAERYLGKKGGILIFIAVAVNSIGCLIAYATGGGSIIAELLGVPFWVATVIFLVPAVFVSWKGLKAIGIGAKYISVGMIIMLLTLAIASLLIGKGDIQRILHSNWAYAIPVFNVGTFAYISQFMAPDLYRGMYDRPKELVKSIAIGVIISGLLLALIPFSVMYVTEPDKITQVATLAWGQALGTWAFFIANLFALCAVCSSYWVLSTTLLTNIVDVFKLKSEWDFKTRASIMILITVVPFLIVVSELVGFVNIIYFTGTFAGTIMAVLPVFMLRSARKNGEIEPDWKNTWTFHPIIQWAIGISYTGTSVYAIFNALGMLPAGW